MKKAPVCILATAVAALPLLATPDLTKLPPASKQEGVTYAKDVRPLFEASCFRCHGQERPKAGLRLDSLQGVLKGSKDGKVIVPGKSEESQLVVAVARIDEELAMPPMRQGRRRGSGGPGGPGGPGGQGGQGGQTPGGPPPTASHGTNQPPGRAPMGPPPKPLTAEQVGLVRAWVDQGAK